MKELYAWYAIVFEESCIRTGTIITPIKEPWEVQIEYADKVIDAFLKEVVLKNNLL